MEFAKVRTETDVLVLFYLEGGHKVALSSTTGKDRKMMKNVAFVLSLGLCSTLGLGVETPDAKKIISYSCESSIPNGNHGQFNYDLKLLVELDETGIVRTIGTPVISVSLADDEGPEILFLKNSPAEPVQIQRSSVVHLSVADSIYGLDLEFAVRRGTENAQLSVFHILGEEALPFRSAIARCESFRVI